MSFFDIVSAKNAFRSLLELRLGDNKRLSVSFVYPKEKAPATFLSSVRESSDSDHDNSDSDRKVRLPAKTKEPTAATPPEPAGNPWQCPFPARVEDDYQFSRTTPLPHHYRLSSYVGEQEEPQQSFNSTMRLAPGSHKFSESSFDDTLSEGYLLCSQYG